MNQELMNVRHELMEKREECTLLERDSTKVSTFIPIHVEKWSNYCRHFCPRNRLTDLQFNSLGVEVSEVSQ